MFSLYADRCISDFHSMIFFVGNRNDKRKDPDNE